MRSDAQVLALADGLASRRAGSTGVIVGGVLGGLVLRVLADTALKKKTCVDDGLGDLKVCTESTNTNLQLVGVSLLVLGPLVGWLMRPTHGDELVVVNAWNARHPLHPLLDGAAIEAS